MRNLYLANLLLATWRNLNWNENFLPHSQKLPICSDAKVKRR